MNPLVLTSSVQREKTVAAAATLQYDTQMHRGTLRATEAHTASTARYLHSPTPAAPPADGPTLFLAPLDAETLAAGCGYDFNVDAFFGPRAAGDPGSAELFRERVQRRAMPRAVATGGCTNSGQAPQGRVGMVLQADVALPPGATRVLYYAYGYFYGDGPADLPADPEAAMRRSLQLWRAWLPKVRARRRAPQARLHAGVLHAHALACFVPRLPQVRASVGIPSLAREIAWHAYYTRSLSVYEGYLDRHTLTQGFYYLFGNGDHSSARDTLQVRRRAPPSPVSARHVPACSPSPRTAAQAALPMVYLNPTQARETLESVIMQATPDGELPNAITGFHLRTPHIWYPSAFPQRWLLPGVACPPAPRPRPG